MLDHPNHFLLSPLAAIMDDLLHISSSWVWVTPNAISCFHVLIAVLAGKCVSSDSLSYRRLGVILFQARTWLDDLDGHVARKRANIKTSNAALRNILLMTVHLFLTSAAWNRYIYLYQDLLETEYRTPSISREHLYARQTTVFRSSSFTIITLCWKFLNFHAVMDYLLLAIFFDRMREYIRLIRWSSYVVVLLLVYVTEFHFLRAYTYIQDYLLEAGWCADGKMIGITEPRRVAATSLSNRVADECNCILGTEVGYSIRFDNYTDETTKIKYMTEGILLRELMSDPLLTNYSVIVVDEVHERTLLTDIIMGLLKKIIRKRRSLRIVVCSATVDAEQLRDFFNTNTSRDSTKDTAVILTIEGRLYPVDIFYIREPVANYVTSVVDTALKIHENEEPGDILAFLTGLDEVDQAISLLSEHAKLIKEGKRE
ncbi:putative ATP-dependent RNA helicase DHX35 [Melipona quadrifasciata]|uniref:RNA helicase n=1 Tax=Melipona quadrifasciata TaxID=166423 RepID=A0A0M9A0Y2_9HYME|nr:putative ATP-dependent RNA helicase DHX35 [Melipona quadrifasciata]